MIEPIVLIPITLIFLAAVVVGRNMLVKRRLRCPRRKRDADVAFVAREWKSSELVRVKSCDLLKDPKKIDCDQECLSHGV